jgi:hypothetical protein|tara:strand:+ start:273 stop:443 length:171 start_codon:yes stop_codon:yes gene_type:complete
MQEPAENAYSKNTQEIEDERLNISEEWKIASSKRDNRIRWLFAKLSANQLASQKLE